MSKKNFTALPTDEIFSVFDESRVELEKRNTDASEAYKRFVDLRALATAQDKFHSFFTSFVKKFASADTLVKQNEVRAKYRDKALALITEVEKAYQKCHGATVTKFTLPNEAPNASTPVEESRNDLSGKIDQLKNMIDKVKEMGA